MTTFKRGDHVDTPDGEGVVLATSYNWYDCDDDFDRSGPRPLPRKVLEVHVKFEAEPSGKVQWTYPVDQVEKIKRLHPTGVLLVEDTIWEGLSAAWWFMFNSPNGEIGRQAAAEVFGWMLGEPNEKSGYAVWETYPGSRWSCERHDAGRHRRPAGRL